MCFNSSLCKNTAVGGAGGGGLAGGDGIGASLCLGYPFGDPGSTVTLTGTVISRNQAIGGAGGGTAMGGGHAVGWGIFFGFPDTSTVTLTGGSVVTNNVPDDVSQL